VRVCHFILGRGDGGTGHSRSQSGESAIGIWEVDILHHHLFRYQERSEAHVAVVIAVEQDLFVVRHLG
jgi:hypothetical protein